MTSSATPTAGLRAAFLAFGLLVAAPVAAQSGKIAGTVTDDTGASIPGANVFVVETSSGATTNLDGDYTILNVSPGEYTLRFTYLGYTTQLVEGVEVNIDQTTTIDVQLQSEDLGLEEITVRAELPVVQPDVSNSQANVTAREIEALPAASVTSVVGLQAGVQGLNVRGSRSDEIAFQVNGLTLRDERNNTPYTNISLASVEAVQVQTGGFNAEYGNVRSGVVNVVTKEGRRDRYEAEVIARYSPPTAKSFDGSPNDPDSYWIRPYIDPEVAFTGTENGAWPLSVQDQYPEFEGWNVIAQRRLEDNDPTNDLTPEALQQAFLWQHRKVIDQGIPDYDVDLGFGGPVPGISRLLGDLRFYASYRREENAYLIPLNTDRYEEQTGHLKVTSNFGDGMKLSVEGRLGTEAGTAASRSGNPGIFRSASGIAGNLSRVSFINSRIFSTDYWAPTEVRSNQLGATFTHSLNQSAFYEVRVNRFASAYDTNPGRLRDTTVAVTFGGVGFDEAPFGFQPNPSTGVDGMRMGVGMSNARDTSRVVVYNAKADLTTQLTQAFQVKTGLELNVTESNVNYGSFDAFLQSSNFLAAWDRTPVRGAAYAQSKLELNGMIANLGLRLDYFNAGGDWYAFSPFDAALAGGGSDPVSVLDTTLTRTPTETILSLSPRLGVSFPVTSVSKLYFNYGHFRSVPDPNQLYLIEYETASGKISEVANPNMPLAKTVAYELGYEQSFFDEFLVRTSGYYKDVSNLPFDVTYLSRDGRVGYDYSQPDAFEDIRGFELTLARNRGSWLTGFVNYTYSVYSSGYFGFRRISENTTEQREFENSAAEQRNASSRPVPRPFGRLNLDLNTPDDFGPSLAGLRPLADWRASFIARWQDGGKYTWAGGGSKPGVLNNVDERDFLGVDLRFTRTFSLGSRDVTFFADVFNLTNRRQFSFNGFVDGNDQLDYLRSLHLPESPDYPNIPGSDRVGDFRPADVAFVPVRSFQSRDAFSGQTESDAYYYEQETGEYLVFRDGGWQAADAAAVQEVLDSKAYIDMPNQGFLTFLGPRNVFLGLRISL